MVDHLLFWVFAVALPVVETRVYAPMRPALRAGDGRLRLRQYWGMMAAIWLIAISTLAAWELADRPFATLGFTVPTHAPSLAALAVAGILSALLFLQVGAVRRRESLREAARRSLESSRGFLPASPRELRWFRALSLSAGIGEEVFYRGFLLWYLPQFLPLTVAVVASSLLFGGAHLLHGTGLAIRAAVAGLVFAGLYVASGSLLAPVLLHSAVDLSSGQIAMMTRDSREADP